MLCLEEIKVGLPHFQLRRKRLQGCVTGMATVPVEKEVEWVPGIHSEGGQRSQARVPAPRWDPSPTVHLTIELSPVAICWMDESGSPAALASYTGPPCAPLSQCSLTLCQPSPFPLLSLSWYLLLPGPAKSPTQNPKSPTIHLPSATSALCFLWTVKNPAWPQAYGKR